MKNKNLRGKRIRLLLTMLLVLSGPLYSQYRFPQPDFTQGYTYPQNELPAAPSPVWDYIDSAVLLLALIAAVLISYRSRKRIHLLGLMLFSVVYFGFLRQGCFCPIGTLQPVVEALFNPEVVIPLSYIVFFCLPLIFALYWGRVFCSGVCPLGALQDLVLIRNIRLPRAVSSVLEMLPPVFLALSLISAATGSEYLICTLDPFIPIFRMSFGSSSLLYSGIWLAASLFIARPYCRFFCPYGFLLKLVSSLSRRRLTASPEKCVSCRLCEDSCPVDALDIPEDHPGVTRDGKRRLKIKFLLFPLIIAAAAFWGHYLGPYLSRIHPEVRLYDYFEHPDDDNAEDREIFLATEDTLEQLGIRADLKIQQWTRYSTWCGAVLGLLLALKLILAETRKKEEEYLPSRDRCVHCLRCVERCPVEHQQRKRGRV